MADHPADRAGREVAKSLKLGFYWVFFHFWRKGWDKSSNPDQSEPVQEVPDSSGFLADHVSQHVRTCAIASDADLYLGLYTQGSQMGRATSKLSVKFVERKDLKPGLYGDGNGLYLQVSNRRTKAGVFRFMINLRPRKMGLGEVERVKLADARKKATAAHSLVVDGIGTEGQEG